MNEGSENAKVQSPPEAKPWPHAPVHRLGTSGTYFVTASTYKRLSLFRSPDRLSFLENCLLGLAEDYGWQLEAWAVLPNHYHFVAHSPTDAGTLRTFLSHLHTTSARQINGIDGQPGRKVWHNFWDTLLTYEKSYLARLNYVHQNAVKHGLVPVANQWRWCSAAWFERTASPAQIKTVYSFKTDKMNVFDPFMMDPIQEGSQ